MTIRTATVKDIPTIRHIAYDTWPTTYGHILEKAQLDYMLEAMYSDPSLKHQFETDHFFYIAETDKQPIGFASFSEADKPGTYKLHKIYVLPTVQNGGIGKALINHVIDEVVKLKGTALRLNVNRYNKALHFYEKMGFEIILEEDIDIGNGYFMNDYVLEKKL